MSRKNQKRYFLSLNTNFGFSLVATSAPDSCILEKRWHLFPIHGGQISFRTNFLSNKYLAFLLVTRQSLCQCNFTRNVLKLKANRNYTGSRKRKFETAISRIICMRVKYCTQIMSFLFKTNTFICKREQSCTICYIFLRSFKQYLGPRQALTECPLLHGNLKKESDTKTDKCI